ncbi:MAG: hypothetical protein WD249_10645 [Gaiellaceae bacterium]
MRKLKLPSPAMVVACIALAVALSGASYAAVKLPRNSVGTQHLKNGAVSTAKLKNGAVTAAKLRANAVGAAKLAANSVDGSKLAANSVDSSKVVDNSIGSADIADGAIAAGDLAPGTLPASSAPGPQAFARVAANGTLQPNVAGFAPQVKGIDAGDLVKGEAGAATGTYCFGSLGFKPASAVVSLDNADAAAADRNLVASVAVDRGEDLGDCPATHNDARVRIVDGNTGAAQDGRFFIWFMR